MIEAILIPVTIANAVIFAVLAMLLAAKKVRRTRGEDASRRRRERFADLLAAPSVDAAASIGHEVVRSAEAMTDLVQALIASPDLTAFRLAAASVGLPLALQAELHARDAARRGRAALALGALAMPETPRVLEPMLRDPDYDVRHAVVRALGMTRDEHAAWAYVRGLRDRLVAPERVLEHLGPWAAEAFNEACHIGELRPIRAILAEGLGLCNDPHAGPAIAGVLSRGNEEERLRACRAIGRIGDPRLGVYLIKALSDHDWDVRAQAANALADLGGANEEAIGRLEQLLADEAWWVRANAADALRAAGPEGIEALRRAAHSKDRFARDRAREALELERVRLEDAA
jgi:HEAT repeat protein